MIYLAVTRETANWLLSSTKSRDAICAHLKPISKVQGLGAGVFAPGPIRMASDAENSIIALWNHEYSSETGTESWGFIRLTGDLGLVSQVNIIRETFERSLYVVFQRLSGLLLKGRLFDRSQGGGVKTCLAGRGSRGRQLSLAYVQRGNSLISIGPARDLDELVTTARPLISECPRLSAIANEVSNAARKRPAIDPSSLREFGSRFRLSHFLSQSERFAQLPILPTQVAMEDAYRTLKMRYDEWTGEDSTLTNAQRIILESDILDSQPLRIVGAAGSGKTLLMQLLAIRHLERARLRKDPVTILFVVHNEAMRQKVINRFATLGAEQYLPDSGDQRLRISTLFAHCIDSLNLDVSNSVVDRDAQMTKRYQQEQVELATDKVFSRLEADAGPLISQVQKDDELKTQFARLVVDEIGVTIKGRGLSDDRKTYREHERALSLLHGGLKPDERDLVFQVFEEYQHESLDQYSVLDADDVAVTMLQRLRTPLWNMERKAEGYDLLFVDETQLFNENERRVFPWLLRGDRVFSPIALALDTAQDLRGRRSAGFALLGIKDMVERPLSTVHRSTESILNLAFNIIQKTTDLFGTDFPDFTKDSSTVIKDDHDLALRPRLLIPQDHTLALGEHVAKQVEIMWRRLRQIAVVCHADRYWDQLESHLRAKKLPFQILSTRGESLPENQRLIVLSTPEFVGGQEFDGVVSVGLEQGLVPRRVQHQSLAAVLEEQARREMYVTFTRARFQMFIWNSYGSAPTALLQDSIKSGLLEVKIY